MYFPEQEVDAAGLVNAPAAATLNDTIINLPDDLDLSPFGGDILNHSPNALHFLNAPHDYSIDTTDLLPLHSASNNITTAPQLI